MVSVPNVIVVVADTVRRDRVSCYGYDRSTTPNLDAFAAGATRFADPVAQGSWSIPSHASLFTGAYPRDHGVTTVSPILHGPETLPEVLSEAGYDTYAVSPNEYVRPRTGFGRGFDEFHTLSGLTVPQRLVDLAAPAVNAVTDTASVRRPIERAFNALQHGPDATVLGDEGHEDDGLVERVGSVLSDADAPFFLFANLMDAHLPRSPAARHYESFVDDDLADVPVVANERAHVFGDSEMDERAFRKLSQLYDADLATMDDRLGRLLETFRAAGVLEDSLVVVLSDHGEHLGEFGLVGHQHSVLDGVVSVPLVVQYPDQSAGRVVDRQVETRRVFHTVLDEAGAREYPERSLTSGTGDELARGSFANPMVDLGRLMWEGTVRYDADLLGEPLSFVRSDGHKLVSHDGDEWLFETPERPERLLDVADHEDVYRRLTGEQADDEEPVPGVAD